MAWPPTIHQDVQDEITAMRAAWTTYTPTWDATSSSPSIGNGSIVGRYRQVGKTVTFSIVLTVGSTTNVGTGIYEFGLPVAARSVDEVVVAAHQTGPTVNYMGRGASTTVLRLNLTTTDANATHTSTGATNGTVVRISGTYEAA
jgi:hypothetical protein